MRGAPSDETRLEERLQEAFESSQLGPVWDVRACRRGAAFNEAF